MALIHILRKTALKKQSDPVNVVRKLVLHKKLGDVIDDILPNLKVRGLISSRCTLRKLTIKDSEEKALKLNQSLEQQGRADCKEFYLIDRSAYNSARLYLISGAMAFLLILGFVLYSIFLQSYPLTIVYNGRDKQDSCAVYVKYGSETRIKRFAGKWRVEGIEPRLFLDDHLELNVYPGLAPMREDWALHLSKKSHLKNEQFVVNLSDSISGVPDVNGVVVCQKYKPVLTNINAQLYVNSFLVPDKYKVKTEDVYYNIPLFHGLYAMKFQGGQVDNMKLDSVESCLQKTSRLLDKSYKLIDLNANNMVVKFSYEK